MSNSVNCPQISVFASCLSAMCGVDVGKQNGQTYSTNLGDNSSFTVTTNVFTAEDECKIEMKRVNKRRGNTTIRCIEARVTLHEDKIDEHHDLFYLVKLPENPSVVASSAQKKPDQSRGDASPTPRFQDETENVNAQIINFGAKNIDKPRTDLCEQDLSNLTKHRNLETPRQQAVVAQQIQTNNCQVIANNKQSCLINKSGSTPQIKESYGAHQQTSFTFQPDGTSGQNSSSQINFVANQADLASETVRQTTTEATNPSYMASESLKQLAAKTLQQSQPNLNKIKTEEILEDSLEDQSQFKINLKAQKSDFIIQNHQNCKSSQKVTFQALQKQQSDKFLCQTNLNSSHFQAENKDDLSSFSQQNNHFDHVRRHARLPRTYADLEKRFTVAVVKEKEAVSENIGVGVFPLSQIPDGKYRIYFFRPKNRDRVLGHHIPSKAQDKLQRVGRGQEFYIFEKNTSSQSPSKTSMISSSSLKDNQNINKSQTLSQPKKLNRDQKSNSQYQKCPIEHQQITQKPLGLRKATSSMILPETIESITLYNAGKSVNLQNQSSQDKQNEFIDDSSLDTEKVRKLNMNVQIPDLNLVEINQNDLKRGDETFLSDLVTPGGQQNNTLSVKLAGSNPLQSTISANHDQSGQNQMKISGSVESGLNNVDHQGDYAGVVTFGGSQGGRNNTCQTQNNLGSGESLTQFNEIQQTTSLNTLPDYQSKKVLHSTEGILMSDQDLQASNLQPPTQNKEVVSQANSLNEDADHTLDIYQTTDKSKDRQEGEVYHGEIMLQSVKVCDFDGPPEQVPQNSLSPQKQAHAILVQKQDTFCQNTTTPSQSFQKAEKSLKKHNVSKNNDDSESSLQILNSMSPMIRKAPNFSSQQKTNSALTKSIDKDLGPLNRFSPVMVEHFQSSGSKERLVTSAFEAAQIKVYQGQNSNDDSNQLLRQIHSSSNMRGSPAEMHNASSLENLNKESDIIDEIHLQIGLPIQEAELKKDGNEKEPNQDLISFPMECDKGQADFYTQLLQTKSQTTLPQMFIENEKSEVERKHQRAINQANSQSELFGNENEINFFEVCQVDLNEEDNKKSTPENVQIIRDLLYQKQQEGNQLPYEQLTRNTQESENSNDQQTSENDKKYANSGYKQLSTVEEENASQCSDLTSSFQHRQLFQSQNNLSLSRKSLKGSLQLQMSNGTPKKELGEDARGFRIGTDLRSFSIAEEVCESENVSTNQVILSGENTLQINPQAISKLSIQEEVESLQSSISGPKEGNFNLGSGGCLSGATTKPGSKLASTGALSVNQPKTNQVLQNSLKNNSSLEISQNNSSENGLSISQCAKQVKIDKKITKDDPLDNYMNQPFVASQIYKSNISVSLMPQNCHPPNQASNTNRNSCQTQSSNPYGIRNNSERQSEDNLKKGQAEVFKRKKGHHVLPGANQIADFNSIESYNEAFQSAPLNQVSQESIESIQKMTGTPDSKQDDSAIIKMINEIQNPEESSQNMLKDGSNNQGTVSVEQQINSDLIYNHLQGQKTTKNAYQKQSLAAILGNQGRPKSQKLSKKKSKENMKNLFSSRQKKQVNSRGAESPKLGQQHSKKTSQTPKLSSEKTKSVSGLYNQPGFGGSLTGSKMFTPLLKKTEMTQIPVQTPKSKQSMQRVLNLNQLTQLKPDGSSLKFLQRIPGNLPPQPVLKKEYAQNLTENQLISASANKDRSNIFKMGAKVNQSKQKQSKQTTTTNRN